MDAVLVEQLPWGAVSAVCSHLQMHRLRSYRWLHQQHGRYLQQQQRQQQLSLPAQNANSYKKFCRADNIQSRVLLRSVGSNDHVTSLYSSSSSCSSSNSSKSSSNSATQAAGGSPLSGLGGGPGNNHNDEFGLKFGEAVLVLREDLPLLFQQDMRYHIFRDDLTFRTPSLRYLTGLWKYQVLHVGVRWLGRLLYSDVQLNIQRMWQPAHNKQQLRVRVCVSGRLRLSMAAEGSRQSTEVISTYSFDSQGNIYEHQVDHIIPPEARLVKLLEWLVGRLQPGAAVPQPQLPLPGLQDGLG